MGHLYKHFFLHISPQPCVYINELSFVRYQKVTMTSSVLIAFISPQMSLKLIHVMFRAQLLKDVLDFVKLG